MLIPHSDEYAFKKRLSGYLIEFNLQKKRYSDGYYYYGISKKEFSTLTLDEIEELRQQEKLTYNFGQKPNIPNNVNNNTLEKLIEDRNELLSNIIEDAIFSDINNKLPL